MKERQEVSLAEAAHNFCEQYPSALIVGSLGRLAYIGQVVEDYRPGGTRRDIDAFRTEVRDEDVATPKHIPVDMKFEEWIRPEANGVHVVFPENESISVEVPFPEDVFAPYEQTINNLPITVPHPEVLGAISTMRFIQRPKDRRNMRIYNEYLDSLDDSNRLPKELLQPFAHFRELLSMQARYVAVSHLRNMYAAVVPEKMRYEKIRISERYQKVKNLVTKSN